MSLQQDPALSNMPGTSVAAKPTCLLQHKLVVQYMTKLPGKDAAQRYQ